jgi:hypothetical protein
MSARESYFCSLLNTRVRKLQNRLFIGSASVLLVFTIASPAQGQTVDTQVTLSCNDGHSVIFEVDQITLTSLLTDVQAINASGTGTICTLDTAAIDPSSETTEWTVYDYNPSNQAIAPRNSPNSMPATSSDSGVTWQFPFRPNIYTALFTTKDPSMTGDLSAKTLQVTVGVDGGSGTFQDQHNGGCVPDEKYVRFYFASPRASGTTGTGTTGFYTQFWWSNPVHVPLATDPQDPLSISQVVNAPSMWSDWNGKRGSDSVEVTEAFMVAIHNVQTVGLSFGGGCFFENGVTTSDGLGTFQSTFTETP